MVGFLNSTESTGRHGQRSLTIKAEEVGAEPLRVLRRVPQHLRHDIVLELFQVGVNLAAIRRLPFLFEQYQNLTLENPGHHRHSEVKNPVHQQLCGMGPWPCTWRQDLENLLHESCKSAQQVMQIVARVGCFVSGKEGVWTVLFR